MRKLIYLCAVAGSAGLLGGCATAGGGSKADKRFTRGEYEPAIELYKKDLAKGRNAGYANLRIAESYRLSNRIGEAEPYYKAALDAKVRSADAPFYYASALKTNGNYDEAAQRFTIYAENGSNRTLVARAELEAKNSKLSQELAATRTRDEVQPVAQLNSTSSEFGAAFMPQTKELVFASGREGKTYLGNGLGFNDLYAIKFDDENAMSGGTVRKLAAPINTADMHEASATYTPDGRFMVFARSNNGTKKQAKLGLQSVDLYMSAYQNGAWTEPELARGLNSRSADDFSPMFSPDGRTLYFASSRSGGQGGTDLYKAELSENGRFSPPENLGEQINTPGNESFPSVAPDGSLYFSSDGHAGLGKLDIFVVEKGKVKNLGAPINSPGDDFAPYLLTNSTGLFASDRSGGQGADDLYSFKRNMFKDVVFFVDGTVQARPAKGGAVQPLGGEPVAVYAKGQKLQDVTADANGKFSLKLDSATAYSLVAERTGYFTARQGVTTVGKRPPQDQLTNDLTEIRIPVTLTLTEIVKNKAIVVENIFYDYDKANIRPDAAVELDKLVETLTDNPKITIELSSHTDSRGKDAYNLALSQRRAQSAVDYIISKGIEANRVTAKGYGETRPVIKNAKTEAEYQQNRRTEFQVTRIAD
ncbi:OmpA family protein [Hymenobacter defluvii]|uniref:PD40 domain-containing protein n=1 Tax=Hymenobacter defluvii TaxID=2054411 RepID=A0ABS3TGU8_9BACT|nr:OmpA family protein [Hymenobacter defluvii]MBO3272588.1 PD40 domain-containing protein [Hymenobacter defluvii]